MIYDLFYKMEDLLREFVQNKAPYQGVLDSLCDVMDSADAETMEAFVFERYPSMKNRKEEMNTWIQRANVLNQCACEAIHGKAITESEHMGVEVLEAERKYSDTLTQYDIQAIREIVDNHLMFGYDEHDELNANSAAEIGAMFRIMQYKGKEGSAVAEKDNEIHKMQEKVNNAMNALIDAYNDVDVYDIKYKIDERLNEICLKNANLYYSPNLKYKDNGDMIATLSWVYDPGMFVDPSVEDYAHIFDFAMSPEEMQKHFDVYEHQAPDFVHDSKEYYLYPTQKNVDYIAEVMAKFGIEIDDVQMKPERFNNGSVKRLVPTIESFEVRIRNVEKFM